MPPVTSTRHPFLRVTPHERAQRLARALVSDLIAYHPGRREAARLLGCRRAEVEADRQRNRYLDARNALAAAREQVVAAHKEQLDHLRKEWGEKFNDRIANLKQFAIDSEAPESVVEAIKNDQLDAASIRWLSKWADATVEKANNTSRDPTPISKLSPDEAEMKINEIMNHPGHWDETHPLHESLIRQRVELERKVPRA